MVEYAPTVSQAEGNEVLRVDSSSFCDYMRDIGLNPEDRVSGVDALMQYGPTPVLVDTGEAGKTDVPEIRCISYTDLERGSGMFSAAVAEGAKIYMSILRQQDVIDSARECLSKLEERMTPARQEGYEYTAFFALLVWLGILFRLVVLTKKKNSSWIIFLLGVTPLDYTLFAK